MNAPETLRTVISASGLGTGHSVATVAAEKRFINAREFGKLLSHLRSATRSGSSTDLTKSLNSLQSGD
jgi:hypothetical protein